ncbi:MAG: DNA mismatch repair protein MutS, partial [Candidatus Bipolaricaulota bacterium]|nr:DNA mismatch repair protein MutS [Candidatus Bipolaricaulota bacterium]
MMKQYLREKARHPSAILLFHLGDFYEAFFEDAELLSRELDVTLTARNGNPMAGVPVRSAESYINRLLRLGHKVALCKQVEDPEQTGELVKREVVQVITPGTTIDAAALDEGINNYLCAVFPVGKRFGIGALDLSTGEFICTEAADRAQLEGEIARLSPSEILLPKEEMEEITPLLPEVALTSLSKDRFAVPEEDGFKIGVSEEALCAAGVILSYVQETQRHILSHIRPLRHYALSERMDLDPFTIRSLELVRPMRTGQRKATLLHVIDRTVTSMGRRLLRRSILAPMTDRRAIEDRLDAVESLVARGLMQQELQGLIGDVHDLERLAGKLGAGRMDPPDLLRLQRSLNRIPLIVAELTEMGAGDAELMDEIRDTLSNPRVGPLCDDMAGMLVDQPPADARAGGLIKTGFDQRLDQLRGEARALRAKLAELERREKQRTHIPSLKVGFNRVFGYYIEVTRTHLDKVPQDYRRRQTLSNAERFTTDELKGYEEQLAVVEERVKALEHELFEQALEKLSEEIPLLQGLADAVALLDFLLSLAIVASNYGYVRPMFTDKHKFVIQAGRHPVVEQIEEFVPNDIDLPVGTELVVLTGPNMSGKSVYLRQIALISLLAQLGSFVPATGATLPIVDRIFARVGASDMLVEGVSTFM